MAEFPPVENDLSAKFLNEKLADAELPLSYAGENAKK